MKAKILIFIYFYIAFVFICSSVLAVIPEGDHRKIAENAINKYNKLFKYWALDVERNISLVKVSEKAWLVIVSRNANDTVPEEMLQEKDQPEYIFPLIYYPEEKWALVDDVKFFSSRNSIAEVFPGGSLENCSHAEVRQARDNLKEDRNIVHWKAELRDIAWTFNHDAKWEKVVLDLERGLSFRIEAESGLINPFSQGEVSNPEDGIPEWFSDDQYVDGAYIYFRDFDIQMPYTIMDGFIEFSDSQHVLGDVYVSIFQGQDRNNITPDISLINHSSAFIDMRIAYFPDGQENRKRKLAEIRKDGYLCWKVIRQNGVRCLERVNFQIQGTTDAGTSKH